jgi:hypothetical protein
MMPILGFWTVLASVALITPGFHRIPGFNRIKDWAYAGTIFELVPQLSICFAAIH